MHSNAAPDGLQIGPIYVRRRTRQGAIAELADAIHARSGLCVGFANTNMLHHAICDVIYAARLQSFLLLNDGIGLALLARLAANRGFPANLNGTDFVPRLLACVFPGTTVFLVGASASVAEAAAKRWRAQFPHLTFVGARDGYRGAEIVAAAQDIVATTPDIVLVAMGNPRQEEWIGDCRARAPGPTYIGVGALFDYTAGAAPRAPMLVRRVRAEWLYRLWLEPARLWRRYSIDAVLVFAHVLRARLARPRAR